MFRAKLLDEHLECFELSFGGCEVACRPLVVITLIHIAQLCKLAEPRYVARRGSLAQAGESGDGAVATCSTLATARALACQVLCDFGGTVCLCV